MPPWEGRRAARSRLGTAHAALPQLQRRLSPFPAAAQRLLPWLLPAPASGRAMASVCAFCLLFLSGPTARGGGSGGPGQAAAAAGASGERCPVPSERLSPDTSKAGAAGTLRGRGSGWPGGWECL